MILRKIIKNNISLTCLWYIIDNWLAGKRLKNGNLKTTSGTRHFGMSLKNSIILIEYLRTIYYTETLIVFQEM